MESVTEKREGQITQTRDLGQRHFKGSHKRSLDKVEVWQRFILVKQDKVGGTRKAGEKRFLLIHRSWD
jgi:hypothetical protein